MKSSIRKTTLREIRLSLGRYLAILAIVALGVGFFSGLKVTTPAMVQTGGAYMNENELFDLRLLSTMGFDKDAPQKLLAEAETFLNEDGEKSIRAIEGSVSTDFLVVSEDDQEFALMGHTLLEVQNGVKLTAGRLPHNGVECVVDASAYSEDAIGSKIVLSKNNDEDTLDLFVYDEYEIVGLVDTSYYVNYERGSTSLGNGKLSGFVFFPAESFDSDYYTEIFLRLSKDYEVYSEEYDAAIEAVTDWAEPLTEEIAYSRYDRIYSEAEEKIADAEAELEEKVADAKKDLEDARIKIEEGQTQLDDANQKISDGEADIASAEKEIADQEKTLADTKQTLSDSRAQLEGALAPLNAAPALAPQLQAQKAYLEEQLAQVAAGEAQVADGEAQIAEAKKELQKGRKELEENKEKLKEASGKLEEGQQEYEDGEKELEKQTKEAEEKIADAKEELAEVEEPDTYVLDRDTNVGYACFENDSAIVEGIGNVFPIFFFLVAALVCITTMNRMVEEQRTQIGVLKALGYSERTIMGKYLFYSGSAAIAGAVIGYIIGCVVFPTVIWEAYKIMYNMGDITLLFDPWLAVISMAAALLCSMGATWMSCRFELRSVAAQLIRPKSPKSGKRILLEKIPFLWKRMSFLVKVSVRNVLRYKKRFFMMLIGIGGCTGLLLTGFGVKDSVVDVASFQYEKIQTYDISATLKDDCSESDRLVLGEIMGDQIEYFALVSEKSMDLTGPDAVKSVTVIVPENTEAMPEFLHLENTEGELLSWPEEGFGILTEQIADKCGIKIGDTVSLRNEDGESLEITIADISVNYVYNYLYISPETWKSQMGEEPEYKGLYIIGAKEADMHELSAALLSDDLVASTSVSKDFMERIGNMMRSLDYIVLLIIVCAGSLAFIVLYNLTNINITERIREIATIKVLGFYPSETASYVFRENIILTALGAVLGLGLGNLLHRFVMAQINVDMISFDVRILPVSYLYSIALTFVFMIIVDMVMKVKLERINMAESLKSIE